MLDAAGKHQVLIFVHSRKETAKTARFLKEEALKEDKLAMFMRVSHPSCSSLLLQGMSWPPTMFLWVSCSVFLTREALHLLFDSKNHECFHIFQPLGQNRPGDRELSGGGMFC